MPWRECHTMDERLRFVARLLDGEKMARLCREFDISRKTGYKIFEPVPGHAACRGSHGPTSRRPYRSRAPAALPGREGHHLKHRSSEHPSWGAREDPGATCCRRLSGIPSARPISTVHAVLDRHGLVERRRPPGSYSARRDLASSSGQRRRTSLWCADYKGELLLAEPCVTATR